eukprot:TRINITY_DN8364_c0_g3_i1.p1 TRINITY_DN8364_c0_g3~~TRINITY_DN8364_c0_g3_i1.p1  ORF type:complete len:325 (+),score=65.83 TRINITY_DN8364_c0_g3_i1:508-1482(+)
MKLSPKQFKALVFLANGAGLVFLVIFVASFSIEDWVAYDAYCESDAHHKGFSSNTARSSTSSHDDAFMKKSMQEASRTHGSRAGGGGDDGEKKPYVVSNTTMSYHFDLYRIRVTGCCCAPYANYTKTPLCCADCERTISYFDCSSDAQSELCDILGRLGVFTIISAFAIVLFGLASVMMTFLRLRLIFTKDSFRPVRGLLWFLAGVWTFVVWMIWTYSGDPEVDDYMEECAFPGGLKQKDAVHNSRNGRLLIFSFSYTIFMAIMNQTLLTQPELEDSIQAAETLLPTRIIEDGLVPPLPNASDLEDVDGETVEVIDGSIITHGG